MSIQPCEKLVIIKDVVTSEKVAYAWCKIAREDLKKKFGITGNLMVFTERERKQRPVIPDNGSDTYSLEFGTTYSIDGDRDGGNRHPKKVLLYSADNVQKAKTDIPTHFDRLGMGSLSNLITVAYGVVFLQVTADNDKVIDKPLVGVSLQYLNNRTLKGALEEIARDIKTCDTVERDGHLRIKENAAFIISFLQEWNQFVNIDKLHLDCSQLREIVEDCYSKSELMTTSLDMVEKKMSELLQSLHGVSECAQNEKEVISTHKQTKEQEQMVATTQATGLRKQRRKAEKKSRRLQRKSEARERWIRNPLNVFVNKLYDVVVGGFSDETYVPCAVRDQRRLHEVQRQVNEKIDEFNRISAVCERTQTFMREIDDYILRLITDSVNLDELVTTVKDLRKVMRSMNDSWNHYREYFSNAFNFVNYRNQQLLSFISYNDNSIEYGDMGPRVLEIVGCCTTLVTAADVYEEVSEKFARPILYHYETCFAENNGIVNQENLKRLLEQNKRDAKEYLERKNAEVLEDAIKKLQEFSIPYTNTDE